MKKLSLLLLVLFTVSIVSAQDFDKVEITTTKLTDNIYMLEGAGGNLGLCIGDDGAFLIDDQFAPLHAKIKAAVAAVTDQEIRFLLNTHFHADHTGGNELIGASGTVIIAHENVRKKLTVEQSVPFFKMTKPPVTHEALPEITFTSGIKIHMNNDEIEIIYTSPAHTDGDAVVIFTNSNVIHAGDIVFSGMYPFIDLDNGGSVSGFIKALDMIIDRCDDNTRVIAGHGSLATKAELEKQSAMMKDVYASVAAMVKDGKTLDEITAAKPTSAHDETYSGGFISGDAFVTFIHRELSE